MARVLAALTLSFATVAACGDDDSSGSASLDAEAGQAEDAGPQADDPASSDGNGARGEAAPFECGNDGSDWKRNWQAMECEVMDLNQRAPDRGR